MGSMKAFASALALAAGTVAGAQTVNGLTPAKAEHVVAATQACMRATRADRVDDATLRAGGWIAAKLTTSDKAMAVPVRVYGKKGGNAIIMLTNAPDTRRLCTVMARVSKAADLATTGQALATSLGKGPVKAGGGQATWFAGGKVVQMQATGSREQPALRVSVMTVPKP